MDRYRPKVDCVQATYVTLFGKRGIKVNLENNVLTRLIGFVEKRGNAFCMRLTHSCQVKNRHISTTF